MKQLNIAVEDDVLALAKQSAEAKGILLRKWVSNAIVDRATLERAEAATPAEARELAPELSYERFED